MAARPPIGREEFERLARRAGLGLSERQLAELPAAYAALLALIEELRGELSREAEPATIFVPDQKTEP